MQDRDLIQGFNLAAPPPGFTADPYPHYAALRRASPVHEMAPGSWLLTRHEDVLATYRSSGVSRKPCTSVDARPIANSDQPFSRGPQPKR